MAGRSSVRSSTLPAVFKFARREISKRQTLAVGGRYQVPEVECAVTDIAITIAI
jgi:hypothetical protein